MSRLRPATASILIGSLALGSCSISGPGGATAAPKGSCPTAAIPIVVSVDQWGDIVDDLTGDCGDVSTIFKSSSADPHDYEPTPADAAKFTDAKLVVVNGLGYDSWADRVVATLGTKPAMVNAGRVVGLTTGVNPHIWYGPEFVYKVADAVTAELEQLQPSDATYFEGRRAAWRSAMRAYDAEIAKITAASKAKTFGATEDLFDYMAGRLGLTNETPAGYERSTANESDPAPGDVNEFEHALATHEITVLIYNTQTEGAIPDEIRGAAEAAGVPVVNVTETVPAHYSTFESWQVSQLSNLATALGADR